MAAIPASEARKMFTDYLVATYKERPMVMNFLRSFFSPVESVSKYVRIEVQRGSEKVAVDVIRGSEGNRNTFETFSEKKFEPPYFREYFNLTELDLYDRLFGDNSVQDAVFTQIVDAGVEKMQEMVKKIERAYELMCSQVFETGIVTVNTGTQIDFKRKSASKVDKGSGNYWVTNTIDPFADLEAGCNFLRTVGKSQGGIFNAIVGATAMSHFKNNTIVQNRADMRNVNDMSIRQPQRNSVGAALHGEVTAGSNIVRLWTYPEYYDDANGTATPFVNPKNVILLPESPNFKMAFAAVPQLIDEENPVPVRGAYVFGDYRDKDKAVHKYDVKSAGVPIPVAVDQIYTVQVVA